MGFGARALEALNAFYNGEYVNLDEVPKETPSISFETAVKQHMVGCLLCSTSDANIVYSRIPPF